MAPACPCLGSHSAGLAPKGPLGEQGSVTVGPHSHPWSRFLPMMPSPRSCPSLISTPPTLPGARPSAPCITHPSQSNHRLKVDITKRAVQSCRCRGTPCHYLGTLACRLSRPASGPGQALAPDTKYGYYPKVPLAGTAGGHRRAPGGGGWLRAPLAGTRALPKPPRLLQYTQMFRSFGSPSCQLGGWSDRFSVPGPQPRWQS